MEMVKAVWAVEGDNVRVQMPISKVDVENRLVSGWASLDNVDTQGDIILAEANRNAFTNFRGNIREMHQPIAVGRMVDFREDVYYDTATEKFYNGIYVTVYVSKGAQDTWEKVLDGTLQGFSIGGSINDAEVVFMKDAGGSVRIVKDYDLVELSLVDSPANQLANVFSITKSADGVVMKGMVADTKSTNVFYCGKDEVAKTSTDESVVCPNGHTMQNIGWFEYADDIEKAAKVAEVIAGVRDTSTVEKQADPANNEGGVDVAEETTTPEAEVEAPAGDAVETETTEEVVENAEVDGAVEEAPETEKAADVSEVEADEPDFAKMFGDLQSAIESGLEKNANEAKAEIEKATAALEEKFGTLSEKHSELTEKFESLKSTLDSVEKSVKVLEDDTAVKKSGDLGGSSEGTLEKSRSSKWGGRFLGISDLNN